MYTIFLARFVAESPDFFGFPANFSTSKKVRAIQSCLRKIGVRPLLIVTHVGDISPRSAVVRKVGNSICIIPASGSFLRNRLLIYIYGLLYSSVIVYKLRKRKRISLFFCWDYLPDTLLPLLLQGAGVLNRTIVDVEESIDADPRASVLFKAFERIVIRNISLRAIGNNLSTAKSLGIHFEGIFPGFFANSFVEEQYLIARTERKVFQVETIILFSGRIDSVRGASQFVELAKQFEFDSGIKFIMTGYGNTDELAIIERRKPTNLTFLPGLPRKDYLDLLFSADIAFNYISDKNFVSNSFPSKVVEYLLGAVVVVSNHKVDINSDRFIVRTDLSSIATYIKEYHADRQQWRKCYQAELVIKEISPYSINNCAKVFRELLNV